jgi:hypothetical protein
MAIPHFVSVTAGAAVMVLLIAGVLALTLAATMFVLDRLIKRSNAFWPLVALIMERRERAEMPPSLSERPSAAEMQRGLDG